MLDRGGLAAWEAGWVGGGRRDLFRPDVLDSDSVAVLALYAGDRVVAGAVLSRSSSGVVGVSNVFARPGLESESWSGCLAFAASLYPATALVGYESGDGLVAARSHGFRTAGPLRVWIHDG